MDEDKARDALAAAFLDAEVWAALDWYDETRPRRGERFDADAHMVAANNLAAILAALRGTT